MSNDGNFLNPDAPFSTLRIEVWHSTGPWAPDVFLGEASIPLVHLMDRDSRSSWIDLSDPQSAAKSLPEGSAAGGSVYLTLQFVDT